jgi:hypothetical protein
MEIFISLNRKWQLISSLGSAKACFSTVKQTSRDGTLLAKPVFTQPIKKHPTPCINRTLIIILY